MKKTVKKLPKSQVEVQIVLDEKEKTKLRTTAIQQISKTASVPGFRKGHIPENVILEQYGEGALLSEMIDNFVPKALAQVIKEENFTMPITPHKVDIKNHDPLSLEVIMTLFPVLTLKEGYKSVKIPAKKISVTKKEINNALEKIQKNNMERFPVDRPAKKDDFVEIDFSGKTPDGVLIDNTSSKMHPIIIGSEVFIPGFEDELIGLKLNEEKEFEIRFPEDYGKKNLAGRPVIFTVTMRGIFEQRKPEFTEEFVEKIYGQKMSSEDFSKEVERILLEEGEKNEWARRENELVDQLVKYVEIDLPDAMIEQQERGIRSFLEEKFSGHEDSMKHFLGIQGNLDEGIHSQARDTLIRMLMFKELGKVLEIIPSEEEIHAELHSGKACHGHHDHHSSDWRDAEDKAEMKKVFEYFLKQE